MSVAAIAKMYLEEQSLEEIASKYDLSLASVHAAMAYYYDHQQEIDHRTAESEAFVEEFKRKNPWIGEIIKSLVLIHEVYTAEQMVGRVEFL